jgi:tetratricopeptide (TPR) repeat protein
MHRFFLSALAGCLLFSLQATAQDASQLLKDAWNEYHFLELELATDYFERALEQSADPAQQHEAQLGLAMVQQFDKNSPDPEKAAPLYEALLAADLEDRLVPLVKSLLAECYADMGDLEKANVLWDEVITGYPDLIVAQDALLERTHANMTDFESEETYAAVQYLDEKRKLFPVPTKERPGLAPAFEQLRGEVFFWRDEFEASRQAYINYLEAGSKETTSYSQRASAIMRVARISEVKLDDKETAGRYYRMLVEETPNDVRSFFALERAVAFGALTIEEVKNLNIYAIDDEVVMKLQERMEN